MIAKSQSLRKDLIWSNSRLGGLGNEFVAMKEFLRGEIRCEEPKGFLVAASQNNLFCLKKWGVRVEEQAMRGIFLFGPSEVNKKCLFLKLILLYRIFEIKLT